jgi:hypothetical protein
LSISYSIILLFDKSRTWEVLDHIAGYTRDVIPADETNPTAAGSPRVALPCSDPEAAIRAPGLKRMDFETLIAFEMDNMLLDYWKVEYEPDLQSSNPQYRKLAEMSAQRIRTENRLSIGIIFLSVRIGSKFVMFELRAPTWSVGRLFRESKSMRRWAKGVLRRFSGLVGLVDIDGSSATLFYKDGHALRKPTWPSHLDPDEYIRLIFNIEYNDENSQSARQTEEQKYIDKRQADQARWEAERTLLGDYRSDDKFSFQLLIEKAHLWDVLRDLSVRSARDGTETWDLKTADLPHFILRDLKLNATPVFGLDDAALQWWEGEKKVRATLDPSAANLESIEKTERGFKSEGRGRLEGIPLEVDLGKDLVVLTFRATGGRMSALFDRSRSLRAVFQDTLRNRGGIAGIINRGGKLGTLFYLEGTELDEKGNFWLSENNLDGLPKLISKRK